MRVCADLWFLGRQPESDISHVHGCTPRGSFQYSQAQVQLPSQLHSVNRPLASTNCDCLVTAARVCETEQLA